MDLDRISRFIEMLTIPLRNNLLPTGVRWIVVDRNLFNVAGVSRIWALINTVYVGERERGRGFFIGQNYRELATYRSIRRGGTERSFNGSLENA